MKIITKITSKINEKKYILLTENNWDDYSYKSTFDLKVYINNKEYYIGEVKLIDNTKDVGRVTVENGIDQLDDRFCSLGQNKEYYQSLRKLGKEIERDLLTTLNDCAYDNIIYDAFSELTQFKTSAVRFSTAEQALNYAKKLYSINIMHETPNECHSFTFHTKLKGFEEHYDLKFSFIKQSESLIPSNINVIIGRNGTGKTQLLSDLARTISGYGFDEKDDLVIARKEKFQDTKHDFGNVIVVSYSAFDNFELPGKNIEEIKELDSQGHIFGYKYCGLRERIDGTNEYKLKNIEEVANEFKKNYDKIVESKKLDDWNEKIKPVVSDPSFRFLDKKQFIKSFDKLSSGQKIVLSILSSIYEHIEENSLVIIDEPETHLHPSLIASFMHSIRAILTEFNSYAIIATHSPVILQESPSKFVQILDGSTLTPRIKKLTNECFGEEISTLTENVFKVSIEDSNFYHTLTTLANGGYSLEQADRIFGKRLGITARSFLNSLKQ
ncbi:AAA family ATPase [Leclercia adecarboxylata]|uniref:AAA family ATPase n=1 Tax=Leclercia adecarboxylata TaxID=83655 RepID=UPI001119F26C|nr:AAA family ATPase [Leclercia adecarboxylata]QCZ29837.1 ATP-binding protein [Leclercia adecarboxylata]